MMMQRLLAIFATAFLALVGFSAAQQEKEQHLRTEARSLATCRPGLKLKFKVLGLSCNISALTIPITLLQLIDPDVKVSTNKCSVTLTNIFNPIDLTAVDNVVNLIEALGIDLSAISVVSVCV